MVLISEVIMIVTTFVTLCQSAPARRGLKGKHEHRHAAQDGPRPGEAGQWSGSGSARSANRTSLDPLVPGTSTGHVQADGSQVLHDTRHRQHDEQSHDSHSSTRRRHAKGQNSRGKYEHLCETTMRTVHLNTDTEEYNPPFYVEVRCRQPAQTHNYANVQKCAFNLLHCVQTYSTLNFSRRKADGSDCWQPFTLDVPSGCECMWPIEEFGPLNRRDDV